MSEIYGKAPLNNSANKWGAWWGFGNRHNDQSIYSTANHGPPPCSGPGASAPPSPMVNAALVVQYIDMAVPELQLIDVRSTLFLQKQIVETFLSSTIKNPHIAHPYPRQKSQTGGTGPKGHFSVGPQRGRKGF